MSKATDDTLAVLHGKVAEAMLSAITQSSKAVNLLVLYPRAKAEINEEDQVCLAEFMQQVRHFLDECTIVEPSMLQAITKFLKDNNITSDPSTDQGLKELREQLDEKTKSKRGRVGDIAIN